MRLQFQINLASINACQLTGTVEIMVQKVKLQIKHYSAVLLLHKGTTWENQHLITNVSSMQSNIWISQSHFGNNCSGYIKSLPTELLAHKKTQRINLRAGVMGVTTLRVQSFSFFTCGKKLQILHVKQNDYFTVSQSGIGPQEVGQSCCDLC